MGGDDLVAFVGAGDMDQLARRWLGLVAAGQARAREWDTRADTLRAAVSPATKVRREEPLAKKTTLGVGGAARLYAEPAGEEDFAALVRAAGVLGLPIMMLGRGSNLVVPDKGVDALVLSLRQPAWETFEARPDGRIWAGAACV